MAEEKKMTIEERLLRIEMITEKLEGNDLSLEESLSEFEKGVALIREAEKALGEAEKRLKTLTEEREESMQDAPLEEES
ncbi:MAG: exodeoxyribonuclease VII small subunit [Lachnospiraceae bacterium]|nr:exodeoxyribonuclease VII small subunit [Lachnospiraceae bacterium]MBR5339551.1 exodeoxyribonuclease VII small subunit [Lachnospiraceae bacterium]